MGGKGGGEIYEIAIKEVYAENTDFVTVESLR